MKKFRLLLSLIFLVGLGSTAIGSVPCSGMSYTCSDGGDMELQETNFYLHCECGSVVLLIDVCNDDEFNLLVAPECMPE
jgi:hypothetical protein